MGRGEREPDITLREGLDASLLVLLDREFVPESRIAVVEWCRLCRRRGGIGFVTGVNARVVTRLSRGLREALYNAGAREVIPVWELIGWLPWRVILLVERGYCWEVVPERLRPLQTGLRRPAAAGHDPLAAKIGLLGGRYADK